MYDLIIIGAGPAGITASVYAARKEMDFIVLTMDIGGQTAWSGDIENYLGYQFITGTELTSKFEEHIKKYNVEVKEAEEVIEISKNGDDVLVRTDSSEYRARSLIVASGKQSKPLGVPGEEEYRNKGVAYCATCDAPLFAGKTVAVIGGGNSALEAALQLIKIAKHIYLINITPELGGDTIIRDKVAASDNVTIMNNSQVKEIFGSTFVEGIKIETEKKEETLSLEGVFVEIGLKPNTAFKSDLEKNEQGEIVVNCNNETNTPGIFAAGDVTNVLEKQIIIAAGEGAKATLSAFRYISKIK
ncbi:MAG: FAD-dependent oxidoreductase [Candidatus Omnitrophica bacterium]|nr:FAD-dependent oxidoreductase [Candidatus Omnitrophota bacterium]